MQRNIKVWLVIAILVLAMSCVLAACAGDTVARSDYEAVCAERDQLASELAQATAENAHAQVEGAFRATVRGVIPDYVLDETTPQIAILTTFQSGPFLATVGEAADQLEVGESYIFQITAADIGEIGAEELAGGTIAAQDAFARYNLFIESFEPAGEDDISGPEAALLSYRQLP